MRRSLMLAVGLSIVIATPAVAMATESGAKTNAVKTVSAKSSKAAAPAAAARAEAPRTLEDINIEGKIAVPQVLFITARDQRRFMGFQHRRYLKSSLTIGEQTVLPSWIVLLADPPHQATKETTP